MRAIDFFLKITSRILPKWTKHNHFIICLPKKKYEISKPVNIEIFPVDFSKYFLSEIILPERRIYTFKNVNILGNGTIFKNLRIFIPSLAWINDFPGLSLGHILKQQWTNKKKKLSGPIALAHDAWSIVNYYHWMIDTLPRLLLLQRFYPGCMILIPEKLPEYVLTTLDIFGFTKTFQLGPYEKAGIANLVFPERVAPIGFQDKEITKETRNVILNHFAVSSTGKKKRIYLSRSKQPIRRLLNEDEFLFVITKYGFETIFFEGMTLEEQVKLMADVDIAIGVNGSNLVNLLFMSPGTTIIELMHNKVNNTCTYTLASSSDIRYFCIPCIAPGQFDLENYIATNNADIIVDINLLEDTLNSVTKGSGSD